MKPKLTALTRIIVRKEMSRMRKTRVRRDIPARLVEAA
jgi:hypothetical protein